MQRTFYNAIAVAFSASNKNSSEFRVYEHPGKISRRRHTPIASHDANVERDRDEGHKPRNRAAGQENRQVLTLAEASQAPETNVRISGANDKDITSPVCPMNDVTC